MAGDTTPKLGYNARLVQRSIEKARKAAQKEAEKAGARKTRRREAKDAAEKQAADKQLQGASSLDRIRILEAIQMDPNLQALV